MRYLLLLLILFAAATALAQPSEVAVYTTAQGRIEAAPAYVAYEISAADSPIERTIPRDVLEAAPLSCTPEQLEQGECAYQHSALDLALLLDALRAEGQTPTWPPMVDDSLAVVLDSLQQASDAAVAEIADLRAQLAAAEGQEEEIAQLEAEVAALSAALAAERAAHARTRSEAIRQLRGVISQLLGAVIALP